MTYGNDDSSSAPLPDEGATAKRLRPSTSSSHQPVELTFNDALSAPPDTVPMDIIINILLKLPVKSLVRFMSVCKPWEALISDPKFAKQHFRATALDPNRRHLMVTSFHKPSRTSVLTDYSLPSLFNSSIPPTPSNRDRPFDYDPYFSFYVIGSCDGMLCITNRPSPRYRDADHQTPFLWNPSTVKLKHLPSFNSQRKHVRLREYGFGYDHLSDTYKVVAVFLHERRVGVGVYDTTVEVHTLGSESWRRIQKFPDLLFIRKIEGSGEFVNGKLNWLVRCGYPRKPLAIVSLDLGTETYEQLLPPKSLARARGDVNFSLTMDALKGRLCILAQSENSSVVWAMKDYGNHESWTKLFNLPYNGTSPIALALGDISKPLCISDEDDEILMQLRHGLAVYGSKTIAWHHDEYELVLYNAKHGTVRNPQIKKLKKCIAAFYTESLICI